MCFKKSAQMLMLATNASYSDIRIMQLHSHAAFSCKPVQHYLGKIRHSTGSSCCALWVSDSPAICNDVFSQISYLYCGHPSLLRQQGQLGSSMLHILL